MRILIRGAYMRMGQQFVPSYKYVFYLRACFISLDAAAMKRKLHYKETYVLAIHQVLSIASFISTYISDTMVSTIVSY